MGGIQLLKVNTLNINGWTTSSSKLKTKIMLYGDPDIVCLSETHLTGGEDKIVVPGYRYYGNERMSVSHRKAGGVAILVNERVYREFTVYPLMVKVEGELAIKCVHKSTGYATIVSSNYLPPSNSQYGKDPEGLFGQLLLMCYEHNDTDLIYMSGDFNARIGAVQEGLKDCPRTSVDLTVNSHGKSLLEFLNDSQCCILNGRKLPASYTCHRVLGSSTVDYGIVPQDVLDKVYSFTVINVEQLVNTTMDCGHLVGPASALPDHELLCAELKATGTVLEEHVRGLGAQRSRKRVVSAPRKYQTGFMNNENIRVALLRTIDGLLAVDNAQMKINEIYEELSKLIREEMSMFKKVGKRKATPYKAYWNPLLTRLWKDMRLAYCNAKKFLNSRDKRRHKLQYSAVPEIVIYREKLRIFDKELRLAKHKYQVEKIADIERLMHTGNPKKFWDAVNKLGPRSKGKVTCEALDQFGNITRDPMTVRELWHKEYANLYGRSQDDGYDDEHRTRLLQELSNDEDAQADAGLNADISRAEIERAVKSTKDRKACGLDGIPSEALRNAPCIDALHKLFRFCFEYGVIPEEWSRCVILPIGKGTTSISTQPLTHRGLALQSCVYKLYSIILNRRLSCYLENNNRLHDTQNGFRPGRSCMDHIYTLSEIIRMNLSSDQSRVYTCFVDIKKAFPSVDRALLLWKMRNVGVTGRMLAAMRAVYRNPQYCVRLNDSDTDVFPSVLGLPEGDPNSPLCFDLYLNGLLEELDASELGLFYGSGATDRIACLAYADDLVLITNSQDKLQKLLNILEHYCSQWRLSVNVEKTKCMIFRKNNRGTTDTIRVTYRGSQVGQVDNYKYLGVVFDETLSFKAHAEVIASSGSRALGAVLSRVSALKDLGYLTYDRLIRACVFSILDYGAEVVGFGKHNAIEDVQQRAARFYMGVNRFCPIPCLNAEMGWLESLVCRKYSAIRYYERLLRMDSERLPKKIFANT